MFKTAFTLRHRGYLLIIGPRRDQSVQSDQRLCYYLLESIVSKLAKNEILFCRKPRRQVFFQNRAVIGMLWGIPHLTKRSLLSHASLPLVDIYWEVLSVPSLIALSVYKTTIHKIGKIIILFIQNLVKWGFDFHWQCKQPFNTEIKLLKYPDIIPSYQSDGPSLNFPA